MHFLSQYFVKRIQERLWEKVLKKEKLCNEFSYQQFGKKLDLKLIA